MVAIGVPVVAQVVAGRGDDHAEAVELVQTEPLAQAAGCEHVKSHLQDVGSVEVVVVSDILAVCAIDLGEELQSASVVDQSAQLE